MVAGSWLLVMEVVVGVGGVVVGGGKRGERRGRVVDTSSSRRFEIRDSRYVEST